MHEVLAEKHVKSSIHHSYSLLGDCECLSSGYRQRNASRQWRQYLRLLFPGNDRRIDVVQPELGC